MKFLLLLSLLLSFPSFATDYIEFTKTAYHDLKKLSPTQSDFQKKALDNFKQHFYFQGFSDRAFYDLKKKMPENEIKEIRSLFQKVFYKNFSLKAHNLIKRIASNPLFQIKEQKKKFTIVQVTGKTKEGQSQLAYYVQPQPDGLKIIDIAVDGVLLSRNYRGAFNRVYREKGFEGLKTKLSHKLKTLNTSQASPPQKTSK